MSIPCDRGAGRGGGGPPSPAALWQRIYLNYGNNENNFNNLLIQLFRHKLNTICILNYDILTQVNCMGALFHDVSANDSLHVTLSRDFFIAFRFWEYEIDKS